MAISNMQQARQLRAGGGIMDLEPRQGFFLGKIAKKITRPLKKVFKSPLLYWNLPEKYTANRKPIR